MQRADWLAVTASAWSPLRAHSPSTIINGDQEDDVAASPFIVLLKRNVLCFTGDDVFALAGLCGLVVEIAMWKRYVCQFPYCSYSPPLSPVCRYHTSTFFTLSDYILSFVLPHDFLCYPPLPVVRLRVTCSGPNHRRFSFSTSYFRTHMPC